MTAAPARQGSAAELVTWLSRAVGVAGIAILIPGMAVGYSQFPLLHPAWLTLMAGGILALSILIPFYAGLRGSIRTFLGLYASVVMVGLVTWPLAWQPPVPAAEAPWLWVCTSMAAISAALVNRVRTGFLYTAVICLGYAAVRLAPSGGGVSPWLAAQDALSLAVVPCGLLAILHVFLEGINELDRSQAATERVEGDMILEQALNERRRLLDGIVHDQVMTALVAAAHDDRPPREVSELAHRALDTLTSAAVPADTGQPVALAHFRRLVTDMVASVSAEARVQLERPVRAGWQVSPQVASLVAQAVREAVLNSERHAHATEVVVGIEPRLVDDVVSLEVFIHDDGVGFDTAAIPRGRHGLRVSVAERMELIGGTSAVTSSPGGGTTVRLAWRDTSPHTSEPRTSDPRGLETVFAVIHGPTFVAVVWAMVLAQIALGWGSLGVLVDQAPVLIAQGVAVVATGLVLSDVQGRRQLGALPAAAAALCLTVIPLLISSALPAGLWPGYAIWHSVVVQVLLIVILGRGQTVIAWLALAGFTIGAAWWARQAEVGFINFAKVVYGPLLWLVLGTFIMRGIDQVGQRIVAARAGSLQAAHALATSFSNLVMREVWLTELREQVGPLLHLLADQEHRLTDAERQACRAAEGRLRDGLRARNLVSFGVSEAIERARTRGVEVVLVDNRGEELPPAARRATLRHLEELVSASPTGRIVARTAPAGDLDVVTILSAIPGEGTRLTTIDAHGGVAVRKP